MLKIGRYQVCVFDLLTDSKTGKLSSSKVWMHVCYGILSYAMMTNPLTWELLTAYGAIVGGNNVATLFLKYRYRDGGDNAKSGSTSIE